MSVGISQWYTFNSKKAGEIAVVAFRNLTAFTKPPPCCGTGASNPTFVAIPVLKSTGSAVDTNRFLSSTGSVGPWALRYNATIPDIYGADIDVPWKVAYPP